jgi:predicted 2-oxoglutarate/Fe(II)-dependent dioxygenase YbiX/peroxiredoxin
MTDQKQPVFAQLLPGDPAPWFKQASMKNPTFAFDTAAGRYLVLCFFGSASDAAGQKMLAAAAAERAMFDDLKLSFFGVTADPEDVATARIAESYPGIRFFLDFDGRVSRLYGALPPDAELVAAAPFRRFWIVLDPTLRVLKTVPTTQDGNEAAELMAWLKTLPAPDMFSGRPIQAPVLYLPNVFEPEFCAHLIESFEADGGTPSGYMQERDGKTVVVTGEEHKKRRDFNLTDQQVMAQARGRIARRIAPEVAKVHQFQATRMERYVVACYDAEEGGHFRAHRDNTTKGTAHRRFAVSINLNHDFDGGDLNFPEYGPQTFKPAPGAAVVFSCSLLHQVSPVTRGRRYAFLPFLYDDAAAKIREANNSFLGESVGRYQNAE